MNAPGSDCAAGAPALLSETCIPGAPGLSAAADETGEGDTGTGLENILVNSPGPDFGAGAPGLSAAADETGEDCIDPAPLGAWLENIRVNSPGADCGAGAPDLSAAADETGESGAGVGATGLLATGADSLDALAPIELNMRVNAPGAAGSACGGGADAGEAGLPCDIEIPTVGSFDGFSMATGLKTCATSFVRPVSAAFGAGFDPAPPPAPGTVKACSIRVNSPGVRGASAAAFTGSAATGAAGWPGAAATAGLGSSASAVFFPGVACPSREASKSSSARGAAGTCPKTPVALEGWSVLCESPGSNGFLGASMRSHLA